MASTASQSRKNRAAACVSVLLGAGTAIVLNGLIAGFRTAGAMDAISPRTVISASFICLALGVRIPQRCTVWLCAPAWRRFVSRGHASEMSVVFLDGVVPDRSLCWAIQSIVALTAGILTAGLPLILKGTLALHAWMRAHFVWSATPLVLLEEATPFVAALLPLTAIGLSVSCAHHLSGVLGQWDTRATAWMSIGAAFGIAGAALVAQVVHQAGAVMVTASLPLLMASVLAAAGSKTPDNRVQERESQRKDLPFWSDRWPLLLRASIIAIGAGNACAMVVWTSGVPDSLEAHLIVLPTMFAFLGVGVLLGCRRKSSGLRSIGGFGVACAAAGLITAVGTYGFHSDGFSGFALPLGAACASVGGMGFATAYGRQTLLHRVASRTAAGATILAGLLVACAATIWIAAPVSIHFLGQTATLMMLGLSMLALGGTLIIHEPTYSRRTRRVRLCAVFASIGALITAVFFSPPIRDGRRFSLSEGSPVKQSGGTYSPTVQPPRGATDNQ